MKIEEVVNVKIGTNLSRMNDTNKSNLLTYTYDDLSEDLDRQYLDSNFETNTLQNFNESNYGYVSNFGDLVFSFVSSKAAIVSIKNQGKILTQNFAKLVIDHDQLDSSYLCYILNESRSIEKQLAISMQGSTVRKLTPSILKELEITIPKLQKQKLIGEYYLNLKKQQALSREQAKLEEQLHLEVLRRLES
ncbi:restriction endonuclease subunit S [Alkalicoccobacillus gibsonii]|uniref:restriction endonuclease subunit S n=1 Tax=Alkalicoccobacillus gibsonii TaxID=79881 RepID=UPI003F7B99A4